MLSSRPFPMIPFSFLPSLSLLSLLLLPLLSHSAITLPPCHQLPKLLCCTERVLEKCAAGCIDYVTEKCPHKLAKMEGIEKISEDVVTVAGMYDNKNEMNLAPVGEYKTSRPSRLVELRRDQEMQVVEEIEAELRRAPTTGDIRALNPAFPITQVTDADLTSECGVSSSRPPFSPCLSRKSVDDLFLTCCQQHVPANCHSLCTFEHREHVAAELIISAVQQDGCDLSHLSKILYCANQNRDNRPCCEQLGLAGTELGVGDRCLRLCNVASSGDRVSSLARDDLVCLSNWNVLMYCARAGLRTIN